MLNFKFILVIFILVGFTLLTTLAFPKPAAAQYNAATQSQAKLIGAHYSQVQHTQARDALTHIDDKRLTNMCIEGGQDKTECLCLTRIFKYELSLKDYKAMALIFGQRSETLAPQGFSTSEFSELKSLQISVPQSPDFLSRCAQAKTYYSAESDS